MGFDFNEEVQYLMILKSEKEIQHMRESGKLLAACHREIAKMMKPGISTLAIDQFVVL